jgi:hypothetical protein
MGIRNHIGLREPRPSACWARYQRLLLSLFFGSNYDFNIYSWGEPSRLICRAAEWALWSIAWSPLLPVMAQPLCHLSMPTCEDTLLATLPPKFKLSVIPPPRRHIPRASTSARRRVVGCDCGVRWPREQKTRARTRLFSVFALLR